MESKVEGDDGGEKVNRKEVKRCFDMKHCHFLKVTLQQMLTVKQKGEPRRTLEKVREGQTE